MIDLGFFETVYLDGFLLIPLYHLSIHWQEQTLFFYIFLLSRHIVAFMTKKAKLSVNEK